MFKCLNANTEKVTEPVGCRSCFLELKNFTLKSTDFFFF